MEQLMQVDWMQYINPQLAFPVVGVILCAFLVFAFGFKSSVQPPSFQFEEDDKRSRKNRRAKKLVTQTNGHIPPGNSVGSVATTKTVTATKKTEKAQSTKSSEAKPTKVKKVVSQSVAAPVKTEKKKLETKPSVDEDTGEWETPLTRKVKAQRRKDRDGRASPSDSQGESGDDAYTYKFDSYDFTKPAPIEEVIQAFASEESSNESPQIQRKKKEKKNKIKNVSKEETPEREVEEEVEEVVVEVKEEVKPIEVPPQETSPEPTTKKSKNKKKKVAAAPIETQKPEQQKEETPEPEPVIQSAPEPVKDTLLSVPEENKAKKSPKKKKKKTTLGDSAPAPEEPSTTNYHQRIPQVAAETKKGPSAALVEKAPKASAPPPAKASASPPANSKIVTPPPIKSAVPPAAVEVNKADADSTPAPVFDELGGSADWTEAKQRTKKKRARRDN